MARKYCLSSKKLCNSLAGKKREGREGRGGARFEREVVTNEVFLLLSECKEVRCHPQGVTCVASWFCRVLMVARVMYIFSFARRLWTMLFAVIIMAFLSLDANFWHSATCFFSSRSRA
jgi:hypothetical protein